MKQKRKKNYYSCHIQKIAHIVKVGIAKLFGVKGSRYVSRQLSSIASEFMKLIAKSNATLDVAYQVVAMSHAVRQEEFPGYVKSRGVIRGGMGERT